jgi:hypothetical protein
MKSGESCWGDKARFGLRSLGRAGVGFMWWAGPNCPMPSCLRMAAFFFVTIISRQTHFLARVSVSKTSSLFGSPHNFTTRPRKINDLLSETPKYNCYVWWFDAIQVMTCSCGTSGLCGWSPSCFRRAMLALGSLILVERALSQVAMIVSTGLRNHAEIQTLYSYYILVD